MKVLVVGSGGREHALAWKLSKTARKVFVAPGNPGISIGSDIQIVDMILSPPFDELVEFIKEHGVDLTVVGPESYLADGICDVLRSRDCLCVGPSQKASRLETSKIWAKRIMSRAGVPTAPYEIFENYETTVSFLKKLPFNGRVVVKVDEIAAGKGVIVCDDIDQALCAVWNFFRNPAFPIRANRVLIEQRLSGREVSIFALCDGEDFVTLGSACDYKRLYDNHLGPNTGGMGAYSPAHWLSEKLRHDIDKRIFSPTLYQMKQDKIPFSGILFAGLMIGPENSLNVLEFNVRFGDPETQALLPLFDDDLIPWLVASAKSKLGDLKKTREVIRYPEKSSIHVVFSAEGYPGTEGYDVVTGDLVEIESSILNKDDELDSSVKIFFAGVKDSPSGRLLTSGGRVLGLTSVGPDLTRCRLNAYRQIEKIRIRGSRYRKDIGL